MQRAPPLDQAGQRLHQPLGKRRHAILVALAPAHRQLQAVEVDIHHAHRTRLAHAQAAAVHQLGDQARGRRHRIEQQAHLAAAEHGGQPMRRLGPHGMERARVDLEHLLVEKHDRVERLVLRGGSHLALDGQVREVCLDLCGAHL